MSFANRMERRHDWLNLPLLMFRHSARRFTVKRSEWEQDDPRRAGSDMIKYGLGWFAGVGSGQDKAFEVFLVLATGEVIAAGKDTGGIVPVGTVQPIDLARLMLDERECVDRRFGRAHYRDWDEEACLRKIACDRTLDSFTAIDRLDWVFRRFGMTGTEMFRRLVWADCEAATHPWQCDCGEQLRVQVDADPDPEVRAREFLWNSPNGPSMMVICPSCGDSLPAQDEGRLRTPEAVRDVDVWGESDWTVDLREIDDA